MPGRLLSALNLEHGFFSFLVAVVILLVILAVTIMATHMIRKWVTVKNFILSLIIGLVSVLVLNGLTRVDPAAAGNESGGEQPVTTVNEAGASNGAGPSTLRGPVPPHGGNRGGQGPVSNGQTEMPQTTNEGTDEPQPPVQGTPPPAGHAASGLRLTQSRHGNSYSFDGSVRFVGGQIIRRALRVGDQIVVNSQISDVGRGTYRVVRVGPPLDREGGVSINIYLEGGSS